VLRLGIITPVVTLNPRAHNAWEEAAGFDAVVAIAEAADRLGYHHLTCSEHVAVPVGAAKVRGARYYDPLPVFGHLAARTTRIRFATHVLVLGYHHPLAVAKRYGSLDVVTGGRLILGVGVGSLREEFELLGAPFEDRGARADDAIRALRASLGLREPSYDGDFYCYDGFVVDPAATRTDVPLWVGGRTARSLRRAVELGDGWVPFGMTVERMAEVLAKRRGDRPIEIVPWPDPPIDPLGDPDRARREVERLAAIGATMLNLRFVSTSLAHHVEQMEAMAQPDVAGPFYEREPSTSDAARSPDS
jgi:probable F420-dependent oxidoreductase